MVDLNTYLSKEESESLGPEFRQFLKGLSNLLDSSIDELLSEMEQRKRLYAEWSNDSDMLRLMNSAKFKPPCAYTPCPVTAMGNFCPGWEQNWALDAARLFGLDDDSFSLKKLRRKLLDEYGIFLRGADFQDGMLNPVFLVHESKAKAQEAILALNSDMKILMLSKNGWTANLPTTVPELNSWMEVHSIFGEEGGDSYPLTEWSLLQSKHFERSNAIEVEEFAELLFPEEYERWRAPLWGNAAKADFFTKFIAHQFPKTSTAFSQKLLYDILLQ